MQTGGSGNQMLLCGHGTSLHCGEESHRAAASLLTLPPPAAGHLPFPQAGSFLVSCRQPCTFSHIQAQGGEGTSPQHSDVLGAQALGRPWQAGASGPCLLSARPEEGPASHPALCPLLVTIRAVQQLRVRGRQMSTSTVMPPVRVGS